MARITVEDCIDKFESRFELVLVASNRARKLHSGDTPTVEKDNDKNTVIALREIADETIAIEEMKNNLVEEYQTVSNQNDEDLSLEYSDETDSDIDEESGNDNKLAAENNFEDLSNESLDQTNKNQEETDNNQEETDNNQEETDNNAEKLDDNKN